MAKRTPGPWSATRDRDIEPGLIKRGWLITGEAGEVVAIVGNGSEGIANMLLIKAAPRLLEVARRIVEEGERFGERRTSDIDLAEVVAFAEGVA